MKHTRILIAVCLLQTLFLQAQSVNEDRFLVKPYLQFATKERIAILWETNEPASSSVAYGAAVMGAKKPQLNKTVRLEGQRLMHELQIEGLQAETNYFWQVTSVTARGDTIRSAIYTFKTAVNDNSAFMFALIGDTQRNGTTPWAWGKIATKVWQERPNFVVLAGDLVDQGFKKTDWTTHFFPYGHELMSRVVVYPVLGNHEQDAPFYYQYISSPAPEYYYTFTYGNAQFFMLDSNRDLSEGSEQYEWLEWELSRSTAQWKIAIHHHPPYSSDSDDHGNTNTGLSELGDTNARNLVPLYERYGLDFCMFGHIHLYERSWPIQDNMINMKEGVVYINSGGAGGGLEEFAPTRSWFTLDVHKDHHYCTFAIFDNQLVFKAIDHEGKYLDGFQMEKDGTKAQKAAMAQPPAVHFRPNALLFRDTTSVAIMAANPALSIRYTTDGSEPSLSSALYTQPVLVDKSTVLRARCYTTDGKASRVNTVELRKSAPRPAKKTGQTKPGLRYRYYEGNWERLPDFKQQTALKNGVVSLASLNDIPHRDNHFGLVLEGYVNIVEEGVQSFYINSDDGSKLFIDGELVIDHDGDHSALKKTGLAMLAPGKHVIRIEYFEAGGSQFLEAGLVDRVIGATPFSAFQLSHE